MGLFGKLFSEKEKELYSPIVGKAVKLSEVSDPTFGEGMLGKGVAILPEGTEVLSPCDGVIEVMFETGHAVSIKTSYGAEVLIHVGLDTVSLKGEHFDVHVKAGDTVTKGQKLITVDIEAVKAKGFDVITPMIICNTDDYAKVNTYVDKSVTNSDVVIGIVE